MTDDHQALPTLWTQGGLETARNMVLWLKSGRWLITV